MMVALKIATTGLDPSVDEIIGICMVDERNTVLFNALIQPVRKLEWDNSPYNKITPADIANAECPITWRELCPVVQDKINELISRGDIILIYNQDFYMNFMPGLTVPAFVDLMPLYSLINGETLDTDSGDTSYKWESMKHASERFGIDPSYYDLGYPVSSAQMLLMVYKAIRRYYGETLNRYIKQRASFDMI